MNAALASLYDQLRERTRSRAAATALIEPNRCRISFGQLWTMAETLTGLLRGAGIGFDDTLAVVQPEGACGIVSLLAATGICASSTMNPALTVAEFEAEFAELGATAVVFDSECKAANTAAAKLGMLRIESERTSSGCEWRVVDSSANLKCSGRQRRNHGDAVILLHTSATTGHRKIVPLSSGNLQAMLDNTCRALRLTPDDRLLMVARLFHVQGVLSPLAQLLAGGSVIAADSFTPRVFSDWVGQYRPTWFTGGPTLHRAILEQLQQNPLPAESSLRFVRSGGSSLAPELHAQLEKCLGIPVLNVYGLTETGGATSTALDETDGARALVKPGSVGKSMGPRIAIMSADGCVLASGEEGEIVISGPSVMAGYLDDPKANAEAFHDSWFRTGDLGRLDADSFLFITGRIKEMINRGGQKIVPTEVDAVLQSHAAVREVATFGVPHATLGEEVACAVVLHPGAVFDELDLRSFASLQLARFKVPRHLFTLDAIPYGATGKPQRLVLRQMFLDGYLAVKRGAALQAAATISSAAAAAQDRKPYDLEECLTQIWSLTLKVEEISPAQDFFAIGGDSLTAATMLAEVEACFSLNVELAKSAFFERPTLEALGSMVIAAMSGQSTGSLPGGIKVVPVREGHHRTAIFLMPADGEEGLRFRRLAKHLQRDLGLSILRPGNAWHELSVSAIDDAGRRSAAAVRAAQPEGPYALGGFCYGGVVAFAAACELERQGHSVSVLLFDVPTPGTPHILRNWRTYWRAAKQRTRRSLREKNPRPLASLGARAVWFALRRARPGKKGVWTALPLQWLCHTVQKGYFSFHYPGSLKGQVTHFLASENEDLLLSESCLGWQQHVFSPLRMQSLPGNHDTLFQEANLPVIARTLENWIRESAL